MAPAVPTEDAIRAILNPGGRLEAHGTTVTFLDSERRYLAAPMSDRFRDHWFFAVETADGVRHELSYSEGFPGGMSPKPSIKIGYRKHMRFDWATLEGGRIELALTVQERGPGYGDTVSVALDRDYEFVDVAIRVSIVGQRPAYSQEQIDVLVRASGASDPATRRMYAEAVVKTVRVATRDLDDRLTEHLAQDNELYAPCDVSRGTGAFAITLGHSATEPGTLELVVSKRHSSDRLR